MDFVYLDAEREREIMDVHRQLMHSVFSKSKTWELEKILGNGTFGVTMLVTNVDPLHVQGKKRLVLKRSLLMNDVLRDEELVKESHNLQRMRGNAHHLQLIASAEEVGYYKRNEDFEPPKLNWFQRLRAMFVNPPMNVIRTISHLEGPAVLLEYLENGDMLTFWNTIWNYEAQIPNRLLWKIYLCLVRAAIGMAYPAGSPAGAPTKLEEFPQGNKEPGRFCHNDMALRNIMIGGRWLGDSEHYVVPIFKLIDYGMSRYYETSQESVGRNLIDIAKTMIWMLSGPNAGREIGQPVEVGGFTTVATGLTDLDNYPHLDPELRFLLCQSMALEDEVRPSLRDTFNRVRMGASKPATSYPGRQIEESNRCIDDFLQRYLFNVPI